MSDEEERLAYRAKSVLTREDYMEISFMISAKYELLRDEALLAVQTGNEDIVLHLAKRRDYFLGLGERLRMHKNVHQIDEEKNESS